MCSYSNALLASLNSRAMGTCPRSIDHSEFCLVESMSQRNEAVPSSRDSRVMNIQIETGHEMSATRIRNVTEVSCQTNRGLKIQSTHDCHTEYNLRRNWDLTSQATLLREFEPIWCVTQGHSPSSEGYRRTWCINSEHVRTYKASNIMFTSVSSCTSLQNTTHLATHMQSVSLASHSQ